MSDTVFAAVQNALTILFGFFALWWLAAFFAGCFFIAVAILWQGLLRRLSR